MTDPPETIWVSGQAPESDSRRDQKIVEVIVPEYQHNPRDKVERPLSHMGAGKHLAKGKALSAERIPADEFP